MNPFSPTFKLIVWIILLCIMVAVTLDAHTGTLLLSRIALASFALHYVFLLLEKK